MWTAVSSSGVRKAGCEGRTRATVKNLGRKSLWEHFLQVGHLYLLLWVTLAHPATRSDPKLLGSLLVWLPSLWICAGEIWWSVKWKVSPAIPRTRVGFNRITEPQEIKQFTILSHQKYGRTCSLLRRSEQKHYPFILGNHKDWIYARICPAAFCTVQGWATHFPDVTENCNTGLKCVTHVTDIVLSWIYKAISILFLLAHFRAALHRLTQCNQLFTVELGITFIVAAFQMPCETLKFYK